jgi:hypothetical protein
MDSPDLLIMDVRVHLLEGNERQHIIRLDPQGGGATIELINKISEGIRSMLERRRSLILPNPSTTYCTDKILWIEFGFRDREDLEREINKQATHRLGFK